MKYYSLNEKVPLKFHIFLTMFLLPLNTAGSLYAAYITFHSRAQLSSAQFVFTLFISVFSALLAIGVWNGLRLFRPFGFYGIHILVWFNTAVQLTMMILNLSGIVTHSVTTSAEQLGYWLLFSVLVTVYYRKRKVLFGFSVPGAPAAPHPENDTELPE